MTTVFFLGVSQSPGKKASDTTRNVANTRIFKNILYKEKKINFLKVFSFLNGQLCRPFLYVLVSRNELLLNRDRQQPIFGKYKQEILRLGTLSFSRQPRYRI